MFEFLIPNTFPAHDSSIISVCKIKSTVGSGSKVRTMDRDHKPAWEIRHVYFRDLAEIRMAALTMAWCMRSRKGLSHPQAWWLVFLPRQVWSRAQVYCAPYQTERNPDCESFSCLVCRGAEAFFLHGLCLMSHVNPRTPAGLRSRTLF